MLCAAFAVSTAYLLVVVHSHAAKIETLEGQLNRYQVPQGGQVWVDHAELRTMLSLKANAVDVTQSLDSLEGTLGNFVNSSALKVTLDETVRPLATNADLRETKTSQAKLFEFTRQLQNDTSNKLEQKADSHALANLRDDMTAGDSKNLGTIESLVNDETAARELSVSSLANSKADQVSFANLSRAVDGKVSTGDFTDTVGTITHLRKDLQDVNASVDIRAMKQVENIQIEKYATLTALGQKASKEALQSKADLSFVDTVEAEVATLRGQAALATNVNDNADDIHELMLEFAQLNCEGVVECGQGGTCRNDGSAGNGHHCSCRSGYQKDGTRDLSPCNNCTELYMKNADNTNCVIDPCKTNGSVAVPHPKDCGGDARGICNSLRSGRCDCVSPHRNGPDGTCEQCEKGYKNAPTCEVDLCWDHVAGAARDCGHGTCSPDTGLCMCEEGWDPTQNCDRCDSMHYLDESGACALDRCKPDVCHGHQSSCVQATGVCECLPNWATPGGGGRGVGLTNQCSVCHEGYASAGSNCVWDSCDSVDCHGHGECVDTPGGAIPQGSCACSDNFDTTKDCATCRPGFTLNDDGDECVIDQCHPNSVARCTPPGSKRCEPSPDGSSATCVCELGYVGDLCDSCALAYVPGPDSTCVSDTCRSHGLDPPTKNCGQTTKPKTGTCSSPNSGNDFQGACICSQGYTGPHCLQCATPEYIAYEGGCVTNPCWDTLHNHSVVCPIFGHNCSMRDDHGGTGNCVCADGESVVGGRCVSRTRLHIKVWGAGGGGGQQSNTNWGGAGGFIEGDYIGRPGQTLRIVVGTGGGGSTAENCGVGRNGLPNGGKGGEDWCSGGGGGSSHVLIDGNVIVGAGGGGGGAPGQSYASGAGGGGGVHGESVGQGGDGENYNSPVRAATAGTNGGGGGGGGYEHTQGGASDYGGNGGNDAHNGASANGAGGSHGTSSSSNVGGGGGGGAASGAGLITDSINIINAVSNAAVNLADTDNSGRYGAGGAQAGGTGTNGAVVVTNAAGQSQPFTVDGDYSL